MMTGIQHTHSFLRWVVLALMIATLVDSLVRMYKPFNEADKKLALFTMISIHTQLLLGLILYFPFLFNVLEVGEPIMKNSINRFYLVEHFLGMAIAATVVTIGYTRAKRQSEKWAKHRMIFFYYLVGFILILASIPWPFRAIAEGRGWL